MEIEAGRVPTLEHGNQKRGNILTHTRAHAPAWARILLHQTTHYTFFGNTITRDEDNR